VPSSSAPTGSADDVSVRVCGIVVAYRPDPESFRTALHSAVPQLDGVIVVDNSPEPESQTSTRRVVEELSRQLGSARAVEVIAMGENVGLSRGINQGIRRANELGYSVFLFLDQDSALAPGAVDVLRGEYRRLAADGSPFALSAENDLSESTTLHRLLDSIFYRYRSGRLEPHSAPLAITSGLLVDAALLEGVGLFDESMFVDSVDHEFCLRARRGGARLYVVPRARILHRLGSSVPRDPTFLGQPYRYSNEDRLYFGIRDSARTSRRYWRDYPLVSSVLLLVAVGRTLAYRAAGPGRRSLYLAARRGWVDAVRTADYPNVPKWASA